MIDYRSCMDGYMNLFPWNNDFSAERFIAFYGMVQGTLRCFQNRKNPKQKYTDDGTDFRRNKADREAFPFSSHILFMDH